MQLDVVVVGAGVSGLQCARTLAEAGARVAVLDRARGVGGRCATRRFDGQPVDFGVHFLHGHDRSFLEALERVEAATVLRGWPRRIHGTGRPCQPEAFARYGWRVAFAEGVTAFPKELARGLDVNLGVTVRSVEVQGSSLLVDAEGSSPLAARCVVLALPIEQSVALLSALPASPARRSVEAVLQMFSSLPCLTLIAGYPQDGPQPEWDISYPSGPSPFLAISHDSAKREAPRRTVLVYQATPRWSRERLESPPEEWTREMLEEAGRQVGEWARTPQWTHPHRWRYGRIDRGPELTAPMVLPFDGGLRVGLVGDVYAPGGGVQAAWLSGRGLAERISQESHNG